MSRFPSFNAILLFILFIFMLFVAPTIYRGMADLSRTTQAAKELRGAM